MSCYTSSCPSVLHFVLRLSVEGNARSFDSKLSSSLSDLGVEDRTNCAKQALSLHKISLQNELLQHTLMVHPEG